MEATQEDPTSVTAGLGEKRPAVDEVGDLLDIGNDAKRSTPVHQSQEGGADLAAESREPESQAMGLADSIAIKVQFGKNIVSVERSLSTSVLQLKQDIEKETGVPTANQKLLFKGTLKDEQTLRQTGLKNGSKLMVLASKPEAVNELSGGTKAAAPSEWDVKQKEVPWSQQDQHKKLLEKKARPDDAWPGIPGKQIPLRDDQTFIPGLLNGHGSKVRLTFRSELGQVWIGSAANTQKISFSSISKIEAQPIEEQPGYSILKIQLGSSGSMYLYYVPSQTVASIKIRILGLASLLE